MLTDDAAQEPPRNIATIICTSPESQTETDDVGVALYKPLMVTIDVLVAQVTLAPHARLTGSVVYYHVRLLEPESDEGAAREVDVAQKGVGCRRR